MKKKIWIFDFDGTVTDSEEEGKPYIQKYQEYLCLLLKMTSEQLSPLLKTELAEITAHPDDYGLRYKGRIVAPALADPYLRMQAMAGRIFDRLKIFLPDRDRECLLNFLYAIDYDFSGTCFKDGAKPMLRELCSTEKILVYIVTNSGTDSVRKKIMTLSGGDTGLYNLGERVIGGAGKFRLGEQPEQLAETMTLDGLSRPVYLRRSSYYDVLNKLRDQHGVGWEDLTVIGDIFELDLALPFALGARIGLVVNQFTPQYEKDFMAAHRTQARLIWSLDQIPDFVL